MARKRACAPGKSPTSPDDSPKRGLQAELRRQKRPAFKARLAAAEQSDGWQRFKQQFQRIANKQEQAGQTTAAPAVPQEWKDAPLKPISGKVWLEGDKDKGIAAGFDRFPQHDNESIRAWSRRLSAAAKRERVRLKASTIETRIHERQHAAVSPNAT